MNGPDERRLAWALAEAARAFLPKGQRPWIYVTIGAGDLDELITNLLSGFRSTATPIPGPLMTQVRSWVSGYAGCETEPRLQRILDGIPLADSGPTVSPR